MEPIGRRGMGLSGKTAVVTGGGRGIGEAIALAFAREGMRVVLASRTPYQLEAVASKIHASGGVALTTRVDVSNPQDVERLAQEAIAAFGEVDVLVNTAGIHGPIGPFVDCDIEGLEHVIRVNLMGTIYSCRALVPHMIRRQRGKIINFAGGGSTSARPRFTGYAVSKTGIVRFTENLAEELRGWSVDVNVIAPGIVDTTLLDDIVRAGERAGRDFHIVRRLRATGEGGTQREVVAELATFLASADSDGLTGKLISVPSDPWREWAGRGKEVSATSLYTLRRIDAFTIKPLLSELDR